MLKTAITAAALGMAAISTPVLAGSSDVPTASVKIADLNLGTAEGQKRLDHRIRSAAKSICHVGKVQSGSRIESPDRKRCYDNAVKSTRNQVATLIEAQQRGG